MHCVFKVFTLVTGRSNLKLQCSRLVFINLFRFDHLERPRQFYPTILFIAFSGNPLKTISGTSGLKNTAVDTCLNGMW